MNLLQYFFVRDVSVAKNAQCRFENPAYYRWIGAQNLSYLREAYLSVQKFPAGDEVAEGQPVDVQELGDDGLRDAFSEVLPDEILFAGEFGLPGQAALGSAQSFSLGFPAG